jgi:hypothetical protein
MPHTAHLILAAWVLAPLYAIADRVVGGAGKRTAAFAAVLVTCAGLAFASGNWALLIMAVAWVGYRSLPFKGAFGSSTPHGSQVATTLFRHALPALVALACSVDHLFGLDWIILAELLAGYALIATTLAVAYAFLTDAHASKGQPGGGENAFIEPARGMAYGTALAVWAAWLVV